MKNRFFIAALLVASLSANAQNIYQLESFSNNDLNGTARYVGMGGAMSALGADLSTMSSNPAGIALYRRSDVAGTLSINSQEESVKFDGKSGSHVSFDQLGFVYAMNVDASTTKFFNVGFNYRKHKNFNQLIDAGMKFGGIAGGPSQTWQMADLDNFWEGPTYGQANLNNATPLTRMGYETYLYDYDNVSQEYSIFNAASNQYNKAKWGAIQDFDISFGFNFSEQFYLGLGLGVSNVDYNSFSRYNENLLGIDAANNVVPMGQSFLENRVDITGTGVDVKLGFIVRPIADNPFRIGVSATSPTYYNLRQRVASGMVYYEENPSINPYNYFYNLDYKYNLYTPWKFNLSLGSTFMNCLAVDAEYEYSDYSKSKIAYGNGYDEWDDDDDQALKSEANRFMNGVSTLKLGMEMYVTPQLAVRLGYNYVSSPMSKSAYYNQFINSASLDYATSTAYMNPSAINRITAGVGANFGNFYADLACMYQNQHGDFYAFNTQAGDNFAKNNLPSTRVKLNKTQLLLTLGYRF